MAKNSQNLSAPNLFLRPFLAIANLLEPLRITDRWTEQRRLFRIEQCDMHIRSHNKTIKGIEGELGEITRKLTAALSRRNQVERTRSVNASQVNASRAARIPPPPPLPVQGQDPTTGIAPPSFQGAVQDQKLAVLLEGLKGLLTQLHLEKAAQAQTVVELQTERENHIKAVRPGSALTEEARVKEEKKAAKRSSRRSSKKPAGKQTGMAEVASALLKLPLLGKGARPGHDMQNALNDSKVLAIETIAGISTVASVLMAEKMAAQNGIVDIERETAQAMQDSIRMGKVARENFIQSRQAIVEMLNGQGIPAASILAQAEQSTLLDTHGAVRIPSAAIVAAQSGVELHSEITESLAHPHTAQATEDVTVGSPLGSDDARVVPGEIASSGHSEEISVEDQGQGFQL